MEFFRTNLVHILQTKKISQHKAFHVVCRDLVLVPNPTQMVVLQISLTIATPGILKISLCLNLQLEYHNDLGTDMNVLILGKHTYMDKKILQDRSDQHHVFSSW